MAFGYVCLPLTLQVLFWVNVLPKTEGYQCLPVNYKSLPCIGDKKVVCYFINWASGRYEPTDVDPSLCTHIIYAFAVLDAQTLQIKSGDPDVDIKKRLYERVAALREKNKSLRILLAIGGWSDSELSEKYSKMVSNEKNREHFISHVVQFLDTYGFDGLDLDWEFPVCWWQNCSKGPASDKENFAKLTKEMRAAFDRHNPPLLLTAAISAVKEVIDESYDIKELNQWLHFINVMTYDYHSDTDHTRTVHHAAMFESIKDYLNVNFTMNYLLEKGATRDKLVLGIPAYGRSYNLLNKDDNGIGALTFNRSVGYVPYEKLCKKLKSKEWTVVRDTQVGPYAYHDSMWIGYDDPKSAFEKARYVRDNGFGGVMTWEVTMDDYKKVCCEVEYPLIKAMLLGMSKNWGSNFSVYGLLKSLPFIVFWLSQY